MRLAPRVGQLSRSTSQPGAESKQCSPTACWNVVITISGQCRTNPWPAVPDWTLLPECRCRTEGDDYRKKSRCRIKFSPAFSYDFSISYSKNNSISSSLWTCRVCHFTLPAVWTCTGYPFHNYQHKQYGREGCTTFLNAGMSDGPAFSQYGTGMSKNADDGTSSVPD